MGPKQLILEVSVSLLGISHNLNSCLASWTDTNSELKNFAIFLVFHLHLPAELLGPCSLGGLYVVSSQSEPGLGVAGLWFSVAQATLQCRVRKGCKKGDHSEERRNQQLSQHHRPNIKSTGESIQVTPGSQKTSQHMGELGHL